MNLKKVMAIYEMIKERLPKTYPRPKLGFFEDEQSLSQNTRIKLNTGDSLYGVCDPRTNTVFLPLKMNMIHTTKTGKEFIRSISISKMDDVEIAQTILHEIFHLLAGERYGYDSSQYHDEILCDKFADRWVKKLIDEKLL